MSDADLDLRSPIDADFGGKVLYKSSTGLEKAMADVDLDRIVRLPDWVITDQWDPYLISVNNLPYLAWAMGVNLWEDIWSESTKREWTANQWTFKSIRGTPAAYKMALGLSGYTVTDMVRPPQGFWLAPNLTKEQWDFWIRQMPELRITYAAREGTRGLDEFYLDTADPDVQQAQVGFLDQDSIMPNDGWVLYGRRAVVRHLGVDTEVYNIEYHPHFEQRGVVDYERYSTIGKSTAGFMLDDGFLSDDGPGGFLCAEEKKPELYTLQLDRSYSHDASTLALTMTVPDLQPINPRYERDSDVGDGNGFLFRDDFWFADPRSGFLDRADGGDRLLADRIYLIDPAVTEPMTEGISFLDVVRLGLPTYTAEVQIDLHTKESPQSLFLEQSFFEDCYLVPEDDSDRERAFRAVVEAKATRDTILVSFAPTRPLRMGDFIPEGAQYDDWVRQTL